MLVLAPSCGCGLITHGGLHSFHEVGASTTPSCSRTFWFAGDGLAPHEHGVVALARHVPDPSHHWPERRQRGRQRGRRAESVDAGGSGGVGASLSHGHQLRYHPPGPRLRLPWE